MEVFLADGGERQVSDTLLPTSRYPVSLIVPGGCAGTAAGCLQQDAQGYIFCRWWGSWLKERCWESLVGTGMVGGCSGLVWAGESAGGVCSVPGEWGEPGVEGRDGYVQVLHNSDLLLRAATVCEERNAKSLVKSNHPDQRTNLCCVVALLS